MPAEIDSPFGEHHLLRERRGQRLGRGEDSARACRRRRLLHELRAPQRAVLTVLPVAGKQNHAAHQRVFEALAVLLGEAGAGDVDDERGVKGHGVRFELLCI